MQSITPPTSLKLATVLADLRAKFAEVAPKKRKGTRQTDKIGVEALTINQFADACGCSARTVYRAVADGTMPPPLCPRGRGRGRSAAWPIAIVAAYLAGEWLPQNSASSVIQDARNLFACTPASKLHEKLRTHPKNGEKGGPAVAGKIIDTQNRK